MWVQQKTSNFFEYECPSRRKTCVVLSMHHSDSDADSKLYYQKTACKRDFMFFVLSVGDFGISVKISCKYLISSFFQNHKSYRNFWCWCKSYVYMWLVMYKFSVVLTWMCFPDDAFCMMHKTHVHNILHHQTIPCEYASMFVMLFIWWYHVVILWNHKSLSKCVHSCNLWRIFEMFFWYLCGFWLYVLLTCFCFWIYFVIFVCCFCVHPYHRDFGVEQLCIIFMMLFLFFKSWFQFFFMKFWLFCFCEKNFVIVISKFLSFCDFCQESWSKHCGIIWISKKNTKSPKLSCNKNWSQKPKYTAYK